MSRYSRRQWRARRRRHHPGRLEVDQVVGIALHWPAMSGRVHTVAGAIASLQAWQNFHMDRHGWSDIAYQEAVDQAGNVYVLRGLRNRSAANGNTTTNGTHGALLLIVGPDEKPTPAMVAAVRRRIARHRELFPRSTRIVGHQDVRPEPTACPGPAVMAAIRAGTFEPRED
jgi:hypothetical protein